MLKFRCKECDQKIGVPDEWSGHIVRCPRCRNAIPVPQTVEVVAQPVEGKPKAAPKAVAPSSPRPPLMPVPPLRGKTVGVPHPAVKPKTVAKPAASKAAQSKPAAISVPPAGKSGKPAKAAPAAKKPSAKPARAKSPEVAPPVAPPHPIVEVEPVASRPVVPEFEPIQAPTEPPSIAPVEPVSVNFEETTRPPFAGEMPQPVAAPIAPDQEPILRQEEVPATSQEASPEPVVVSAKRTVSEPIVTEAPTSKDFSSLFADSALRDVGQVDSGSAPIAPSPAEPAPSVQSTTDEPASDLFESRMDVVEPVAKPPATPGPRLSEMIDALGGPEDLGITSSATVSDIVKGLTKERVEEEPPPAPPIPAPRPAPIPRPASRPIPESSTLARSLGFVAMLVGVGALSLCVMPRWTRFALPVGALGLVIAAIGAMVPARRRGTEVALALGSSAVSLAGIALAILVAIGIVPSAHGGRGLFHAGPSARVGDVEVKVASAAVVRPVLYADGGRKLETDAQPVLRVDLEVRNLSGGGSIPYKSWGMLRTDVEPVILEDNEGNQLKLIDPAPKTPPGRPREFPTSLASHSKGVCDVLLFEAPPAAAQQLRLQLPGSNVQARAVFTLQIPASMLRK
jgi:hypothetical protein